MRFVSSLGSFELPAIQLVEVTTYLNYFNLFRNYRCLIEKSREGYRDPDFSQVAWKLNSLLKIPAVISYWLVSNISISQFIPTRLKTTTIFQIFSIEIAKIPYGDFLLSSKTWVPLPLLIEVVNFLRGKKPQNEIFKNNKIEKIQAFLLALYFAKVSFVALTKIGTWKQSLAIFSLTLLVDILPITVFLLNDQTEKENILKNERSNNLMFFFLICNACLAAAIAPLHYLSNRIPPAESVLNANLTLASALSCFLNIKELYR